MKPFKKKKKLKNKRPTKVKQRKVKAWAIVNFYFEAKPPFIAEVYFTKEAAERQIKNVDIPNPRLSIEPRLKIISVELSLPTKVTKKK